MKRPIKLAVYCLALVGVYATVRGCEEFLEGDKCLDRGGSWDYQHSLCDLSDSREMPINVYQALHDYKFLKAPLLGNFNKGAEFFRSSDAKTEANEVFKESGLKLIVLQSSLVPPGFRDLKTAKIYIQKYENEFLVIPATPDSIPVGGSSYFQAALDYAIEFNEQMLKLEKESQAK